MKVWIIITVSLINHLYKLRKKEYIAGISKIVDRFKNNPKYNIIIIENTSLISNPLKIVKHQTFLDLFGVPVFYTKNNLILNYTANYGIVELIDIFDCIKHFQIPDDDFIVKLTGRYIVEDDSPFFEMVDKLDESPYSAIVRFGEFDGPAKAEKYKSISTGLVGLTCKYIKKIEKPPMIEFAPIEYSWAKVVCEIDDSEICMLQKLGILLRPKYHKDLSYVCM